MTKALDVKRPAFLILGAPGSGKGTQGKILGSIPRFFHCACGDAFRSLDTRTAIGRRFVEYSRRGELVPNELTVELWKAQVDNLAESHVYQPDIDFLVLDATRPPVEVLGEIISKVVTLPVYLDTADHIV